MDFLSEAQSSPNGQTKKSGKYWLPRLFHQKINFSSFGIKKKRVFLRLGLKQQ